MTQPEFISDALARMANMPVLDQLLLIIERDWWQDAALSAGNIFFSVTLIPMLRHPGKPPLLTCIPTALGWRAVAGFGIQEAPSAPQGFRRISALARLAMSRR